MLRTNLAIQISNAGLASMNDFFFMHAFPRFKEMARLMNLIDGI